MIDFEAAKDYILNKLMNELGSCLYYHGYSHTIDVYDCVKKLAEMEHVNGHDLLLLKTAALFHDSGFLTQYRDHEKESVNLAGSVLPAYGYSEDDIDKIKGMIIATKLPPNPGSLCEKILCDADLDYLGRDDFFMIAGKLLCEWNCNGIPTPLKKWYTIQANFLESIHYFTESARSLRNEKKKENLDQILEVLAEN